MKRAMSLSLVLLMASASPAMADDATVEAQVTVATICITVDPTPIDYGILTFAEGSSNLGTGQTSFTNCSTQPEDVYVRGTDASSTTSGATWTLGQSWGSLLPCDKSNVYEHAVHDLSRSTAVTLSANEALLSVAVASAAVTDVQTELFMPCTGSDGAGETFTFSIMFSVVAAR